MHITVVQRQCLKLNSYRSNCDEPFLVNLSFEPIAGNIAGFTAQGAYAKGTNKKAMTVFLQTQTAFPAGTKVRLTFKDGDKDREINGVTGAPSEDFTYVVRDNESAADTGIGTIDAERLQPNKNDHLMKTPATPDPVNEGDIKREDELNKEHNPPLRTSEAPEEYQGPEESTPFGDRV